MTDLIHYAEGSPFLLLCLVIVSAVLYAAERVFALSGPMSALIRWWQNRELAKLKREAQLRAERRRIQMEEESAVMADLRTQLQDLTKEVARLRGVVRTAEAHNRVMRDWADGMLRTARSAGLRYVDPPRTGEQPAVRA